uniref:Uncharacterized protein n=1 Tax=Brassica oleracea var. oleracea TaxID=109376 RepID=A0A0D3DAT1_BRAOL
MANLLSDEPTTNSIMKKVKMFEADQRRLFSQFEVQEFCDNIMEGVVKALKDVKQTIAELTFLQAGHPSSLVLFSQDFEEKSFDYPHQRPLLDTRRPLDDGLGLIFDEEEELGPTFDEKAPSMTSINMENHLCFDPGTTPTPLTTDIQEHLFEPDKLLDQKCFQHDNGINSGFVLSFDQFLKHSKGFDHFEESLELDFDDLWPGKTALLWAQDAKGMSSAASPPH